MRKIQSEITDCRLWQVTTNKNTLLESLSSRIIAAEKKRLFTKQQKMGKNLKRNTKYTCKLWDEIKRYNLRSSQFLKK